MIASFYPIAKKLNDVFGIEPLLYGSLGLQLLVEQQVDVDDIDVLIPYELLDGKWERLQALMHGEGYTMVDLHEHTFAKGEISISFAKIDDLEEYASISLCDAAMIQQHDARFMLLTLPQYLKVYTESSKDSYRKDKNNAKDFKRIEMIQNILRNKASAT